MENSKIKNFVNNLFEKKSVDDVIETAKKCLNEKKCSGSKITLQTLCDLEFLDMQANPVTKEYYNPESYVEIKDANYTFIVVR